VGQGNFIDHARCIRAGMPTMMSATRMEYVVTPETTYISNRHGTCGEIFTDGRPWPTEVEPTYQATRSAIGSTRPAKGVYDVLEAETVARSRARAPYDATGLPLHFDNESVFKEAVPSRQERSEPPA